ncbi:MAG: hypothetical protein U0838_03850 [Chloroflexota bacterium]
MSLAATGRAIVFRLGADLAVTNREAEYGQLLRAARDLGYRIVTVAELWDRREAARGERLLAIRHDVDIRNAAGNAMFLRVELAHGAKATSYFRRWTTAAHAAHIERLHAAGFEVGYHFEEAATVAKELGLTTREAVLEQRERIRDRFAANCAEFRQRWSPEMRSVSSHGDWVNRRLGFVNNEFLDAELRERCGLDFEAYDEPLMAAADVYVSDVAAPPRAGRTATAWATRCETAARPSTSLPTSASGTATRSRRRRRTSTASSTIWRFGGEPAPDVPATAAPGT